MPRSPVVRMRSVQPPSTSMMALHSLWIIGSEISLPDCSSLMISSSQRHSSPSRRPCLCYYSRLPLHPVDNLPDSGILLVCDPLGSISTPLPNVRPGKAFSQLHSSPHCYTAPYTSHQLAYHLILPVHRCIYCNRGMAVSCMCRWTCAMLECHLRLVTEHRCMM